MVILVILVTLVILVILVILVTLVILVILVILVNEKKIGFHMIRLLLFLRDNENLTKGKIFDCVQSQLTGRVIVICCQLVICCHARTTAELTLKAWFKKHSR